MLFIAYPHRDRFIGVWPPGFGGDHQVEFRRQRLVVFDFHLIPQLGVRPASPGFRAGNTAELLHLFWRTGDVKDEAVSLVANIVVGDFQHIDVALVAIGVDNGIFKGRFALPLRFINVLNGLLATQLALRNTPVGGERQRRRPQLTHLVAAIDPDEVIPRGEVGQLVAQRGGVFAFRQRFNALIGDAQQQRQTEVAPGERHHAFLAVDGEIFQLFREIPQADNVRFPRQHFFLHVEEYL